MRYPLAKETEIRSVGHYALNYELYELAVFSRRSFLHNQQWLRHRQSLKHSEVDSHELSISSYWSHFIRFWITMKINILLMEQTCNIEINRYNMCSIWAIVPLLLTLKSFRHMLIVPSVICSDAILQWQPLQFLETKLMKTVWESSCVLGISFRWNRSHWWSDRAPLISASNEIYMTCTDAYEIQYEAQTERAWFSSDKKTLK